MIQTYNFFEIIILAFGGGAVIAGMIWLFVAGIFKVQERKQNKVLITQMKGMTKEQRKEFLKDGGSGSLSKKEVEEYERNRKTRRRLFAKLRLIESGKRSNETGDLFATIGEDGAKRVFVSASDLKSDVTTNGSNPAEFGSSNGDKQKAGDSDSEVITF